jgi:uncharacterized protein YggE
VASNQIEVVGVALRDVAPDEAKASVSVRCGIASAGEAARAAMEARRSVSPTRPDDRSAGARGQRG